MKARDAFRAIVKKSLPQDRLVHVGPVSIRRHFRTLAIGPTSALALDPPGGSGPGASDDGQTYGELWHPPNLADAMAQIFNTTDADSFERGGQVDFDWIAGTLRPEQTALDLGCGIGRVAYYVAGYCQQLWAVDASPRMLELAKQRMSERQNVRYALCHDVAFPDVPSESVDVAYSLLTLQHVEREDAFLLLEELRRVIRPGGWVILTFPNLLDPGYLKSFVDSAHQRGASHVGRARPYTTEEVNCLIEAAGFETPQLDVDVEIRIVARRP